MKEKLATSGRHFLVTIDDIDRLDDNEIRAIMQMVKTIGRLPNVLYILVYDREIVWRALDESSDRVGPKFAEKIVQQEVELPLPSRHALLSILDREIAFLAGSAPNSSRWHYIVQDGVHRWIKLPRDVVRLSNALKFSWAALKGEFDPQDLLAIEGIRLFDPETFEWIRGNRDFLFNEGRFYMGNDEARKSIVEPLQAQIRPENVERIMRLLAVLFPHQGKWFQGERSYQSESYAASQSRRGIASEAGYDSYFALRPSTDAIPKSVIDAVFDNLNDEPKLRQALSAYLGKINRRGKSMIGLLLLDLRYRFADHPKPKVSQGLLNAVLSIGEDVLNIPWSGELFVPEPSGTFRYLVRDFLEAWGGI